MTKQDLAGKIAAAAFLKGSFKLRSGRTSSVYWDKYRFESDPKLLSAIATELVRILPGSYDYLAGMELGGIPLATALSLQTGKLCLYVRKAAKEYGTCNLVEGAFKPGDRTVVIEDVITTAGQVCTSIEQMRALGLKVNHVLCVVDREEGGRENLARIGCDLRSLFRQSDLEASADRT